MHIFILADVVSQLGEMHFSIKLDVIFMCMHGCIFRLAQYVNVATHHRKFESGATRRHAALGRVAILPTTCRRPW